MKFKKKKSKLAKVSFYTLELFRHTILETHFFLSIMHEIKSTGDPILDFLVPNCSVKKHFQIDVMYGMETKKRCFRSKNDECQVEF